MKPNFSIVIVFDSKGHSKCFPNDDIAVNFIDSVRQLDGCDAESLPLCRFRADFYSLESDDNSCVSVVEQIFKS